MDGLDMMKANMAAFESGGDVPYADDYNEPEPITEEPAEEQPEEPVDELLEELAEEHDDKRKDGYMTKEEWIAAGKDPDDYMSQEDFDRVGDLRDDKGVTRQQLAKQLVQQEAMLKELMQNQTKMLSDAEERGRREALEKLNAQQQEAIEDNDTERALEIEREKAKYNEKPKDDNPPEPEVPANVKQWLDNNNHWYGSDPSATNLINVELKKLERDNVPFEEAIKKAEAKARKYFPFYFDEEPEQPRPRRPAQVTEQSRRPAQREKTLTFDSLPPEIRETAKKIAKRSGMSEQDYMKSYMGQ